MPFDQAKALTMLLGLSALALLLQRPPALDLHPHAAFEIRAVVPSWQSFAALNACTQSDGTFCPESLGP